MDCALLTVGDKYFLIFSVTALRICKLNIHGILMQFDHSLEGSQMGRGCRVGSKKGVDSRGSVVGGGGGGERDQGIVWRQCCGAEGSNGNKEQGGGREGSVGIGAGRQGEADANREQRKEKKRLRGCSVEKREQSSGKSDQGVQKVSVGSRTERGSQEQTEGAGKDEEKTGGSWGGQ